MLYPRKMGAAKEAVVDMGDWLVVRMAHRADRLVLDPHLYIFGGKKAADSSASNSKRL